MTKKIFQSILLVAGCVLLASLLIIMGFLYDYFGGVEENQLRDELSLAAAAVEDGGTDYLSRLTADRCRLTWIAADGSVLYDVAFRNQTEVQRAGLRALMEGKSWQQAFAVMQVAANMDRIRGLAEAAGMTFETDLFGNSHAEEYFARLAQYAAARVSELTKEISSISGASRRPETAKKYGVDVKAELWPA